MHRARQETQARRAAPKTRARRIRRVRPVPPPHLTGSFRSFASATRRTANRQADELYRETAEERRIPMAPPIRSRRSVLFLPGSNPRALEKARALPADSLIFDLEDAVAPEVKDTARAGVAAARAHGRAVLDGVHLDLGDAEGFAAACRQGRELGFDGKTVIHPQQIGPANAAFTPTAEEAAKARRIIAAYAAASAAGKGAARIEGRLVEALHVEDARRTLALVEA